MEDAYPRLHEKRGCPKRAVSFLIDPGNSPKRLKKKDKIKIHKKVETNEPLL
jgi:hypothetical protein